VSEKGAPSTPKRTKSESGSSKAPVKKEAVLSEEDLDSIKEEAYLSARRAIMTEPPKEIGGKGVIFSGLAKDVPYATWKAAVQMDIYLGELEGKSAAKAVLGRLGGTALQTAMSAVLRKKKESVSEDTFFDALDAVYLGAHVQSIEVAVAHLSGLRQGKMTVTEYIEKVNAITAGLNMETKMVIGFIRRGIKKELAIATGAVAYDDIGTYEGALRQMEAVIGTYATPAPNPRGGSGRGGYRGGYRGGGFQRGRGAETMERDMSQVVCYNCSKKGHMARECRGPRKARAAITAAAPTDQGYVEEIPEEDLNHQ